MIGGQYAGEAGLLWMMACSSAVSSTAGPWELEFDRVQVVPGLLVTPGHAALPPQGVIVLQDLVKRMIVPLCLVLLGAAAAAAVPCHARSHGSAVAVT
jgi:hypothetical protein